MRLATFKDTETGEVIPQMAEKIKQLSGVDITDLNGQLKNTYDIYTEIGKVYKDLDQNTQMQLNEILGGKLRGNIVSAILSNVSELQRAYDLANNSAGSAMNEFEKYQEGIEYSIDRLKEQVNGLYTSFVNSDFLKGLTDNTTDAIGMFNKLISTIGSFPTTVTLATGAITIFNKSFRENIQIMTSAIPGIGKLQDKYATYVSGLDKQIAKLKEDIATKKMSIATNIQAGNSTQTLSKEVMGLQQQLVISTAKTIALKTAMIALQAITTSLISFGISALISGFSKLIDSAITTKDELNEMKESFSLAFSETSELDTLVQKQRELKDQLKDTTLSTDEQKIKKEELIDVQRQLAELLPETATGFDSEGNKISEDTGLIQENIEKKKELLAMESVNIAKETNNGEWNKLLNDYKKQIDKVKELQEIYNDTPTPINLENLTEAESKLDSYKEKLKQLSEMMSAWKDAEFSDKDMSELLFGDIYDDSKYEQGIQAEKFSELKQLVDEYTASIQENTKAKEENGSVNTASDTSEVQSSVNLLQSTYEKLGYTVKEATDRIAELNEMSLESQNAEIVKDATTAYGEAISKTKELDSILKEINEKQSMTPELIMELAEKYPELGSRITDVASVQEFLNNKIQEQTKAQVEAYQIMVQNDQAYYNSKILNNEELNKNFQALCASFVDDQGNAYSIDLKNYTSLAQLKAKLTEDLGEGVANFITNFVTANAEGYSVDLSNTSSWASSKAKILQDLNTQIKKLEKNMSSALSKIQSDAYTGMKAGDLEAEKLYTMASNQLKEAQSKYEEIQTEFSTYNKGFSSYTPSFSSGSFSNGSGSGNKGSSSSSKEVENIQIETDRYYDLNNAIEKVNNALEINDILSKNANDDAKLKYIKEEISLYNQKRQALEKLQAEQKKELSEMQGSLSKNGFTFDADGNISNLNPRLKGLESWANSASGTEKENRQTTVKNIQSMIDSYEDLRGKVSDINADILDINNSIIDAQKDIADVIKDQYEEWKDLEEKKTDKLKEEIQKRKEMMEKEWETEDYQDELDEEQNKLNELMVQRQDAIRTGNENLISQLDKEIEEQRKTINDLIRDQERNNASDKYDEMIDTLDKELDAKLEAMDEKVTDDALLQAVQSGATSLEDIFSNIDLASRSVNKNILMVSDGITDWNTKLNDFVSTLNSISASAISLDLNSSLQGVTTLTGSSNPINISTTINLEGGTVIGETEMNDIITKNNKYIFKEINNIFKR